MYIFQDNSILLASSLFNIFLPRTFFTFSNDIIKFSNWNLCHPTYIPNEMSSKSSTFVEKVVLETKRTR